MSNDYQYNHKVMNRNGIVTMFPNIKELADLKQEYPINVYAESSTQLFPLGTKAIQGERVWRYCKNGGTGLNIAAPLQNAAAVHADQQEDIGVGVAAAIGDYIVSLTSTADLDTSPNDEANNFAEGYIIVNDAAGEGQMYKIKSNEAFAGTAESLFTLYDALTIALTTSSQCGLICNPYYKVIATAAVVTGMFVGVPLIPVTASYWFWAQTGGPAPVIPQAGISLGDLVVVGTTAAKANAHAAVNTELIIGHAMTPAIADTESFIVFLTGDR